MIQSSQLTKKEPIIKFAQERIEEVEVGVGVIDKITAKKNLENKDNIGRSSSLVQNIMKIIGKKVI